MNDDAQLIERIRAGAPDEFSELIRRHQSQVFAILYRYERDHHKLEDLAQETFLKAWRFLDRYDARAPFQHWLSKIAVNVALDHLRRIKHVRTEINFEQLGEDVFDWLADGREKENLPAKQAAELLHEAMRQLSPEDRVLLTLLELEGRSVKEVCALLEASGAAVRVRAFRARAKLKTILERMERQNHGQPETK